MKLIAKTTTALACALLALGGATLTAPQADAVELTPKAATPSIAAAAAALAAGTAQSAPTTVTPASTPLVPLASTADAAPAAAQSVAEVVANGTTTPYASLAEALAAMPADATVNLLADATLTPPEGSNYAFRAAQGFTLNGNGHTIKLGGYGFGLMGNEDASSPNNYVMRNVTLTNDSTPGLDIMTGSNYLSLRLEGVTLEATSSANNQCLTVSGHTPDAVDITLSGCTVRASRAGYGIIVYRPVNLTIADTDISGYAALYLKGSQGNIPGSGGSVVNIVDGSHLSSTGIPGPSNEFGTIVLERTSNVKVNVENSTVEAQSNSAAGNDAAPQSVVLCSNYATSDDDLAHGNTVAFGKGSNVKALGTNSALISTNGKSNDLKANDGEYLVEGDVVKKGVSGDTPDATKMTVTGGKWNRDVSDYVPEGYASSRQGGAGQPYVIEPAEPTTPDNPNPHTDTPDTPGTTDKPTDGNQGTTGDKTNSGTTTDQTGDNGSTNHEGEGDGAGTTDKSDQSDADKSKDKSTTTTHRTTSSSPSTYRSNYGKTRTIAQTGDEVAALAAGAAALAVASAGAATLARRRRNAQR